MTYEESTRFLYDKLPMFTQIGSQAYRPGLDNILELCEYLKNPHQKFKSIHIAGTNGKGSTSHLIASILQTAGYKTGLYTSPHLKSFTERIRINGVEISQERVAEFVTKHQPYIEYSNASFFEVTTAMAFDYFAQEKVDIAIIETGLGGRLDSTNVISPTLSIITNISYDHMDILGDTLEKIAYEKAGIIKNNIPVIISERHTKTIDAIFIQKASECKSPTYFTDDILVEHITSTKELLEVKVSVYEQLWFQNLATTLTGSYQIKNIKGVLKAILQLRNLGYLITDKHIFKGSLEVKERTGLKGRWQTIQKNPLIICDTGHNEAGIREIVTQIENTPHSKLYFVIGMVRDKDISKILKLLPTHAFYIYCNATIPRAMNASELMEIGLKNHLEGVCIPNVNQAITYAKSLANKDDLIFVGGSTFVVAEIDEI